MHILILFNPPSKYKRIDKPIHIDKLHGSADRSIATCPPHFRMFPFHDLHLARFSGQPRNINGGRVAPRLCVHKRGRGTQGSLSHPVLEGKPNVNHVRVRIKNTRTHQLHNWTSSHNAQIIAEISVTLLHHDSQYIHIVINLNINQSAERNVVR
jgi:hypothetical protein